jgi:hypothetical protein
LAVLFPPVILLVLLLMLYGLVATAEVGFGLLILLILLVDDILVGDLEFLLFWVCSRVWVHLRHVEDLEHSIEVEVLHVQTFQDDLSYDEVDIVLLQLDLAEEVEEELLGDGAFSVAFGS